MILTMKMMIWKMTVTRRWTKMKKWQLRKKMVTKTTTKGASIFRSMIIDNVSLPTKIHTTSSLIFRVYSDDDDISWKVRRSSSKLLAAIIGTRHELLTQLYHSVSPALVNRFKEREESVRVDVLQTFIVLLRQTYVYGGESYIPRDNDHEPKRRRAVGPSESQERYNP